MKFKKKITAWYCLWCDAYTADIVVSVSKQKCRQCSFSIGGLDVRTVRGLWQTSNLFTINWTIANDVTFHCNCNTANAGNKITMDAFSVELQIAETTVS